MEIKENMIKNLISSKIPVTLALDGWTNVRSNKVTNLLLIANGISYYYASIENYNKQNNKEWLVSKISEKIDNMLDKGINLIALATDNEIVMKSTSIELKNKYPILITIPCSAHLIQLCLKNICNINVIKSIISNIITITNNFKYKENKIKLYNLQFKNDVNVPLKIIYPTEVRWSSIIYTIERILKLKDYIKNIIKLNIKEWDDIELLYNLILPIDKYTNIVQKDNATLYTVWSSFNNLIKFYKSSDILEKLKVEKKDVVEIIDNYWNKYIDKTLICVLKLFCFDQTTKISKNEINFITDWGVLYLKNNDYDFNENVTKKNLISQINKFIIRQGDFIKIEEYITEIKDDEDNSTNISYISKLVWGRYIIEYCELSKVAIALLSICPSEACVERSFSILSDVHTLDRNRLSNDIIDAELSIKMNLKK